MADVLTFKNLQDKVLAWLDEAGDTSTTLTLAKNAIIDAHKKRLSQERWPFMLWPAPQRLSTVVNQQVYTLHAEYLRPLYFWNRNQLDYMSQFDEATIVTSGVDPNNDTGPALKFVLWGRGEVATQPTSASVLHVTSDQAADNGSKHIVVRGDTANGVRSETIVCNATGSVSFTNILKITKVGTWAGTLTVRSNTDTVTNLVLFAEEAGRSFQQIKILTIPDVAEDIDYLFYRQPSPLSLDEDRPDIPTPFEEILVYDALLSFAAYNEYDGSTVRLWTDKRNELWLAMQQVYGDAEALEATTNYTSYVPR